MGGFRYLFDGLAGLGRLLGTDPVPLAARLALAGLLATAGMYKLRHPLIAAATAVNFRVIAHPWRAAGYALGLAETLAAVLLLLPAPAVFAGCAWAGVLSAGYVVVTARALRAHERFPCGCLPGGGDVSALTLARALAMAGAAIVGALGPAGGHTVDGSAVLPGVGLAAAFLGLPLAVFAATAAWRQYRRLIAETDWEWVIAVRTGHVAVAADRDRRRDD